MSTQCPAKTADTSKQPYEINLNGFTGGSHGCTDGDFEYEDNKGFGGKIRYKEKVATGAGTPPVPMYMYCCSVSDNTGVGVSVDCLQPDAFISCGITPPTNTVDICKQTKPELKPIGTNMQVPEQITLLEPTIVAVHVAGSILDSACTASVYSYVNTINGQHQYKDMSSGGKYLHCCSATPTAATGVSSVDCLSTGAHIGCSITPSTTNNDICEQITDSTALPQTEALVLTSGPNPIGAKAVPKCYPQLFTPLASADQICYANRIGFSAINSATGATTAATLSAADTLTHWSFTDSNTNPPTPNANRDTDTKYWGCDKDSCINDYYCATAYDLGCAPTASGGNKSHKCQKFSSLASEDVICYAKRIGSSSFHALTTEAEVIGHWLANFKDKTNTEKKWGCDSKSLEYPCLKDADCGDDYLCQEVTGGKAFHMCKKSDPDCGSKKCKETEICVDTKKKGQSSSSIKECRNIKKLVPKLADADAQCYATERMFGPWTVDTSDNITPNQVTKTTVTDHWMYEPDGRYSENTFWGCDTKALERECERSIECPIGQNCVKDSETKIKKCKKCDGLSKDECVKDGKCVLDSSDICLQCVADADCQTSEWTSTKSGSMSMQYPTCNDKFQCISCKTFQLMDGTNEDKAKFCNDEAGCSWREAMSLCVNTGQSSSSSSTDLWSMNDGLGLVFLIVGIVGVVILAAIFCWKKCCGDYSYYSSRRVSKYSDSWTTTDDSADWSSDSRGRTSSRTSYSTSRSESSYRR